jgi:hypothetical protein
MSSSYVSTAPNTQPAPWVYRITGSSPVAPLGRMIRIDTVPEGPPAIVVSSISTSGFLNLTGLSLVDRLAPLDRAEVGQVRRVRCRVGELLGHRLQHNTCNGSGGHASPSFSRGITAWFRDGTKVRRFVRTSHPWKPWSRPRPGPAPAVRGGSNPLGRTGKPVQSIVAAWRPAIAGDADELATVAAPDVIASLEVGSLVAHCSARLRHFRVRVRPACKQTKGSSGAC